jgi:signal transduction histidine kinase/DNA-binding response OmpR family regulator
LTWVIYLGQQKKFLGMTVRVLIIDDSEAIIDILTDILGRQGYQVESCLDGESGWQRLLAGAEGKTPAPDLLLLDLMMPRIDGLTLLRRIRSDERFALLPVIVLTVRAESGVRLEALRLGANDYLAKPFETAELLARVKTLLGWKLAERIQQQRMEHLVEAGRVLLSTLNLEHTLKRVMEIVSHGVEAECSSIWLKAPNDKLECRAASGRYGRQLIGLALPPGKGIAGWALHNRQSVLVPDVQSDPRFQSDIDNQLRGHTRDLIAVPLVVRNVGVGVVEVVNKREGLFSPADLAWLEVLAPLIAGAIANARLFNTLERRRSELQLRNEELDAFSHTVAHDLRNPLATVIGFAETLEVTHKTLPEEELEGYLAKIARIGRRMDNIVESLLLLAQVRKMDVRINPINMKAVVGRVLDQMTRLIERSGAEIVFPDSWPVAMGYAPWVELVWSNYISNAIKYGGSPPYVELGTTLEPEGWVRFWVRDNGPGLSEKELSQLFTPFIQLSQISEGHGLGLSIVRRILDKLGGTVGVKSEVGQGSVFSFSLPALHDQNNG